MLPVFILGRRIGMNLENLFKWDKVLTIKDEDGEVVKIDDEPVILYQRVIGDADLEKARREALRASKRLRKKLKKQNTIEHETMLPDYEEFSNEELKNAIVIAEVADLRQRARNQAQLPTYPSKPDSNASLEAQEAYQEELDTYDKRVEEAVMQELNKLIEQRKKELKGLHKDTLTEVFESSVIDSLCRAEMLEVFNLWQAYLGTFKDEQMTQKAFSSFEAFDNAASHLKQQVVNGYIDLELDGSELKK
jgi:rRNA-processing protein FCF1